MPNQKSGGRYKRLAGGRIVPVDYTPEPPVPAEPATVEPVEPDPGELIDIYPEEGE